MKIETKRLIAIILAICLFGSYIIFQIVNSTKDDIKTQYALTETVYNSIDSRAFVIRDEEFIENNSTGTIVSFAADGERVARGDTVSMVFSSEESAEAYLRITEVEKSIERYEKLESQANAQVININTLNSKADNEFSEYLKAIDDCDFERVNSEADDYRDCITDMQIATNGALDFSEQLNTLCGELSDLRGTELSYSEIKSNNAGYYIGGSDGYENIIKYADIDSLTPEDVESAVKAEPAANNENIAGRTVSSFIWYIACVIDSDYAVNLADDAELFVNFPYRGIEKLPVKLYKVGDKGADKTLVILSCDLMNESLASLRVEDVEIVTKQYTGLKIPSSAIRTVDGETGVYVVSGTIIEFKKVHIVYAADDFTVVDNPESESGFIKLYDKVVTEGVELYDYKLI